MTEDKQPTQEKPKITRIHPFDDTDRQILTLLIQEPGITQKQIAPRVGLTGPAVNGRIQKLKDNGILLGFSPVLNLQKIGYDITVLVNAQIKNGRLVEAAKKYAKDTHVINAYTITGEYDMVLVAKFHNTHELETWNQKMTQDTDYIERINTSLVFTTQKENTNPNRIE